MGSGRCGRLVAQFGFCGMIDFMLPVEIQTEFAAGEEFVQESQMWLDQSHCLNFFLCPIETK